MRHKYVAMVGNLMYFSHTAQLTSSARPHRSLAKCGAFCCSSFTCSQDSPREPLDAVSPEVTRHERTPAARALCSHQTSRVARGQIGEIDALGRRRWDGLWLTAGKTAHLFRASTLIGAFSFSAPPHPLLRAGSAAGADLFQTCPTESSAWSIYSACSTRSTGSNC